LHHLAGCEFCFQMSRRALETIESVNV
jgi:hypothetical protein